LKHFFAIFWTVSILFSCGTSPENAAKEAPVHEKSADSINDDEGDSPTEAMNLPPSTPETSEAPVTPETIETPKTSEISESSEAPETTETTETPNTFEKSEISESSEAPATPETSEIPETPETSEKSADSLSDIKDDSDSPSDAMDLQPLLPETSEAPPVMPNPSRADVTRNNLDETRTLSESSLVNPLLMDQPESPPIADQPVDVDSSAAALSGPVPAPLPPTENTASTKEAPEQTGQTANKASDFLQNNSAAASAFPSRLLDSPGEFTITLDGLGWIFRSDRSTPGSWRFMERIRNEKSTGFRFQFTESGKWNLVFERQDPLSGGSEQVTRTVQVGEASENPLIESNPLPEEAENPISGNLPLDPDSRNLAAADAVAEGNLDQAIEFWENDASKPDEDGRRAREAIVKLASSSGTVGPLMTWLPLYIEDGADVDTLAAALNVFDSQMGYERQSMEILDALANLDGSDRRPEWIYRLAVMLSEPGSERDLDRAAQLYQMLISTWPFSSWRERAEEQLLMLQRHYFRVR